MNKEKIAKWFLNNFRVHSDWTGDWVEYDQHCSNVHDLIEDFFNECDENE